MGWTPRLNLTRGAGDVAAGAIAVDSAGRIHLLAGRSGQSLWTLRYDNQVQADWSPLPG
jgi:hypothetical protein